MKVQIMEQVVGEVKVVVADLLWRPEFSIIKLACMQL